MTDETSATHPPVAPKVVLMDHNELAMQAASARIQNTLNRVFRNVNHDPQVILALWDITHRVFMQYVHLDEGASINSEPTLALSGVMDDSKPTLALSGVMHDSNQSCEIRTMPRTAHESNKIPAYLTVLASVAQKYPEVAELQRHGVLHELILTLFGSTGD